MQLVFRSANHNDLRELLTLLDEGSLLGGHAPASDKDIPRSTIDGFNAVLASADNELVIVENDREIIGMMQLTFIPGITFSGSPRLLIEGVRIKSSHRNQGTGRKMLEWAIEQARIRKCRLVQLLSSKQRADAARFYQNLGFEMSHNGFKLFL